MFKRIFEEPRYTIAAVGGLVAIQGFIFTAIDAGPFSVSMTLLGLAVVAGGLHVEARPVLTRISNELPMYLGRIKARLGQFKQNCFEQSKRKYEQFNGDRARRTEERELQRRRERASAKKLEITPTVDSAPPADVTDENSDSSMNLVEACERMTEVESSPNFLSATPIQAHIPEPQAEEELDPFANLVEAHTAKNQSAGFPVFAGVSSTPPSVPARQPVRVLCPYCGELIASTAVKCRYCNEFLDSRSNLALQSPPAQYESHYKSQAPSEPKAAEFQVWSSHPKMLRNSPIAFLISCFLIPVFGLGLLILLIWWLSCIYTTLTVTNRRTIFRTGILAKHTREVRHEDVRYLEVQQSFTDRIFGVGTIAISSSGQSGLELEITGIEAPQEVKNMIDGYR